MKLITFYSSLFVLVLIHHNVFPQTITISGKVRDLNTHIEIPSVNIFIKGTQIGTASDVGGRFSLEIAKPNQKMVVVFQHIAYDVRELPLDSVKILKTIYLQPRVIPLKGLEIEAPGEKLEIRKDLPQAVAVLKSESFEIRGFADAGDLLRTDHSVQVEEQMSGKKTIAIRGGNSDEVVVLYNGIKMNSAFDNVFDLSLIDLEDIERFELIKGSNTALYGSGALAGIINIVPRIKQDYHIRFQQRIGTYRSGNWGIHLYQPFHRFHASYSYKEGATKRQFSDTSIEEKSLENQATHHTANLVYNFSESVDGSPPNSLGAMYIRSSLDYDNHRDLENLSNLNQIISVKYQGDIYKLRQLNVSGSYHQLDEIQHLSMGSQDESRFIDRELLNDTYSFRAEKRFNITPIEILLAYQFEDAELDYQDGFSFIQSSDSSYTVQLSRQHHGLVAIAKAHSPTGSKFIPAIDFDLSLRHDRVEDEKCRRHFSENSGTSEKSPVSEFPATHIWNETMFKFSSNVSAVREHIAFVAYMNFGTNVKFPTLFQQISYPLSSAYAATQPNLNPERNNSMEIGLEITRNVSNHPNIYGWQISGNYFKNYYENKFRTFYMPGIPVAFYDNVQDAHISGIETQSSLFMFKKKVTLELGFSRYAISEKAAFPFKYDRKLTLDFEVNHHGYAFQLHLFNEGDQVGWIRQDSLGFIEIELPSRTDIDLHLSKTFEIGRFKLMTNFSARNILNDDFELAGLALRDRRYYFTIGIQY